MSDFDDYMTPSELQASQIIQQKNCEITRLRAEVHLLKTAGIAEVAAHNPSVMDYMRHWEDRALKSEAEVEQARMREACAADLAREWEQHCKTAEAEVERLRAEAGQARAIALEEAARVAETCHVGWPMDGREQRNVCAAAIRALKP